MARPSKVREPQSFLGFINFYAEYLADATQLTAQLYDLTTGHKGDDPIKLSPQNVAAFEESSANSALRRNSRTPISSALSRCTQTPRTSQSARSFSSETRMVSSVRLVFSKKLSSAQRNYSTFERECLAVICALEHFRVICWVVSLRCVPIIERSRGIFRRSQRPPREFPVGSRR